MLIKPGNNYKKLGIIGGLGPLASAHLYKLITQMTLAAADQDHLEIILLSLPRIPDRSRFVFDPNAPSPILSIKSAAEQLASLGAECIAIPCVTAHCFVKEISSCISLPIVDMVHETARLVSRHQLNKVGLLATDGTIACGVFHNALAVYGIETINPPAVDQEQIMHIIYEQIKANKPVNTEAFRQICQRLKNKGAQAIILGCTELSLLEQPAEAVDLFFDALSILAESCVYYCTKTEI